MIAPHPTRNRNPNQRIFGRLPLLAPLRNDPREQGDEVEDDNDPDHGGGHRVVGRSSHAHRAKRRTGAGAGMGVSSPSGGMETGSQRQQNHPSERAAANSLLVDGPPIRRRNRSLLAITMHSEGSQTENNRGHEDHYHQQRQTRTSTSTSTSITKKVKTKSAARKAGTVWGTNTTNKSRKHRHSAHGTKRKSKTKSRSRTTTTGDDNQHGSGNSNSNNNNRRRRDHQKQREEAAAMDARSNNTAVVGRILHEAFEKMNGTLNDNNNNRKKSDHKQLKQMKKTNRKRKKKKNNNINPHNITLNIITPQIRVQTNHQTFQQQNTLTKNKLKTTTAGDASGARPTVTQQTAPLTGARAGETVIRQSVSSSSSRQKHIRTEKKVNFIDMIKENPSLFKRKTNNNRKRKGK